jgi:hypothetical protein
MNQFLFTGLFESSCLLEASYEAGVTHSKRLRCNTLVHGEVSKSLVIMLPVPE